VLHFGVQKNAPEDRFSDKRPYEEFVSFTCDWWAHLCDGVQLSNAIFNPLSVLWSPRRQEEAGYITKDKFE
jgi:hypothetical protein